MDVRKIQEDSLFHSIKILWTIKFHSISAEDQNASCRTIVRVSDMETTISRLLTFINETKLTWLESMC